MKPIITILLAVIILFACNSSKNEKSAAAFYMPAEWEPHDAVWLGWEEDSARGYYSGIVSLLKTLTPHVTVKMAFNSDSLMQTAKAYLRRQAVDSSNLKFYVMPGERYWIRDHGAAFLVNDKGELGVADFAWNSYGYPGFLKLKYEGNIDSTNKYYALRNEKRLKTAAVDSQMAVAEGAIIQKTNVVHEGGAIEVNGKGTLILCEATVFERNPDLEKEYIETEFKRMLGVSKIIWVRKGLADDPLHFFRQITGNYVGGGTGGHTDEFVRFANANTIMLAWVNEEEKDLNPINKMNYERMSENLAILEQATDQDGKPFHIIKLPLPDLIVKKILTREKIDSTEITLDIPVKSFIPSERPKAGDTLLRVPASSYMNYLVTNGLVVLPTYVQMGSSAAKEDQVKQIFQRQFPGRKIIFLDFIMQNWSGGGIHCSTQQQPVKKGK
ncbi:MAG: agmatine deiminase family protein [Chitinophagaceae bacterium]